MLNLFMIFRRNTAPGVFFRQVAYLVKREVCIRTSAIEEKRAYTCTVFCIAYLPKHKSSCSYTIDK